jgi:hypothetical protein
MSPDGKWIWDGAQWRPIPVHEAAFPNWKNVGSGFAPEADLAAQPSPVAAPPGRRAASPPAPSYRLAGPAPGLAVPRWSTGAAATGLMRYASLAVAAAALVVVIVTVSVLATLFLTRPNPPAAPTTITQKGGPTARSDSARAAYIIKTLDPQIADLKDNLTLVRQTCINMTSSCEDSLISVENKVSAMLPVLDNANIPQCIAAAEKNFRADLGRTVDGEQIAVKGFNDNKKSEYLTGYAQTLAYGNRAASGFSTLKSAAASCDSALTGP